MLKHLGTFWSQSTVPWISRTAFLEGMGLAILSIDNTTRNGTSISTAAWLPKLAKSVLAWETNHSEVEC
jgi:hypothetical protein